MTDFFELIKFDDTKTGTVDFSGQDADLTLAEQREYLDRFAKEYASYKNLSQTEPLVSQEECRAVLSALPKERNDVRGRVEISDMEISLLSQPMFRYLTLYTRRAVVKKGAIVFRDGYKYPVPCAELDAGGEIASVRLFITIGEEYRTPLRGGVSPIVPGRTIEFRRGIEEIAKLQFYTDGQAIVRINRPDRYHHRLWTAQAGVRPLRRGDGNHGRIFRAGVFGPSGRRRKTGVFPSVAISGQRVFRRRGVSCRGVARPSGRNPHEGGEDSSRL